MSFEFWLEILLATLLAMTIGYCIVLDRKLRGMRRAQGDLQGLLQNFTAATARAEESVAALRQASTELSLELDERIDSGRSLRDELILINQSGNAIAERIENGLGGRPGKIEAGAAAKAAPAPRSTGPRSESERELMQALRAGS